MQLPRRQLGRTGLTVSALGYGSMELRGAPRGRELTEADVGRLLGAVVDHGIDVIDTSIDYGAAEERIGRHLAHRRDEFVLASKCGCLVGWEPVGPDDRSPHNYRPGNLVAGVEQSLRRLRTDHLDVLQVHLSPSRSELETCDVVATLEGLRDAGKTRFLGMSATLPHARDHLAMGVFDVFQLPYSLLQREHEQVLDAAAAAGAGVLVRGGAGKGVPSATGRAATRHAALDATWQDLVARGLDGGDDPMAFVLRWTLTHPGTSSVIVGTADLDHLAANVAAAARGPLADDVVAGVRARLDGAH